jgi:4-amino-4-deoxy-L-arabinose transferase-like glycosyltransferase
MYSLLTMCIVICLLGLSYWLVREIGMTSTRRSLLLYVAGMGGALWTHNMAILVWATICLWGLLGGKRHLLPRRRPFWLAQGAVCLLWLHWPSIVASGSRRPRGIR